MHKIAMLGTGLIGRFYTMSLLNFRGRDEVAVVCGAHEDKARQFPEEFRIPRWTDDIEKAIRDPEVDTVVIGLPNYLHKKAVLLAAEAGKAVLCTKPLAISGAEALEMLEAVNDDVNEAQVFMDHPSQLDNLKQLNEEDYMQDNIEQPGDVLDDKLDNYDYTQELKDSDDEAMSVSIDSGDLGPEDGEDYHDDKQFDSDIENGYED